MFDLFPILSSLLIPFRRVDQHQVDDAIREHAVVRVDAALHKHTVVGVDVALCERVHAIFQEHDVVERVHTAFWELTVVWVDASYS